MGAYQQAEDIYKAFFLIIAEDVRKSAEEHKKVKQCSLQAIRLMISVANNTEHLLEVMEEMEKF